MAQRKVNFGSGPAVLPVPVLEEVRDNLLSLGDSGVGVLEVGHRTPAFDAILASAEASLRRLLGLDDAWEVLFLPGGASLQFTMVPMNLGPDGDYVLTGHWSERAYEEALRVGEPEIAASTEASGFTRVPEAIDVRPDASYVHVTSNNTIEGTQWREVPRTAAPLVCDASSDILSRPLDLSRYALVYAGAQKNLGPAGVTLVLVRRALLPRSSPRLPTLLSYAAQAEHGSRFNTPPVFAIYVLERVCRWVEAQGGLAEMSRRSEARAAKVYAAIDACPLYRGTAHPASRSRTNVTFRVAADGLERRFLEEAEREGLVGLKGHRTVGGVRASLYNAMPDEGVDRLVAFLHAFAAAHAPSAARV